MVIYRKSKIALASRPRAGFGGAAVLYSAGRIISPKRSPQKGEAARLLFDTLTSAPGSKTGLLLSLAVGARSEPMALTVLIIKAKVQASFQGFTETLLTIHALLV